MTAMWHSQQVKKKVATLNVNVNQLVALSCGRTARSRMQYSLFYIFFFMKTTAIIRIRNNRPE